MTVFYADLSHHDWDRANGLINWAMVQQATSGVLCVRATYGDPNGFHPETRHFLDMQAGARAAGFICRGGYHNLVAGDAASMRRQVSWFRSELDKAGCHWAMVDIERYNELVNNGLWPRFADVLRFRDAWAAQDDRPLAYYMPNWLWHEYYGSPDLRELGGPLVASDYGANAVGRPSFLYAARGGDAGRGWNTYGNIMPAIWQFGSMCSVSGLNGATDINAFRGTAAQLVALLTGDDMSVGDVLVGMSQLFREAADRSTPTGRNFANWFYKLVRDAGLPADIVARLDAILAAAKDDSDVTVVLPPSAITELEEIKAAIAAVPQATIAEIAS